LLPNSHMLINNCPLMKSPKLKTASQVLPVTRAKQKEPLSPCFMTRGQCHIFLAILYNRHVSNLLFSITLGPLTAITIFQVLPSPWKIFFPITFPQAPVLEFSPSWVSFSLPYC
jgi:hypothetical protein